jgi:HPt (histidine-containing phosphotransfer) domain-containing protein
MAQLATKITEPAPAAPAGAIDRGHLARMTFGDRGLEREVLQLFDRQADLLLARMRGGDAATVQALAHTLKGSAASIGATGVVDAAATIERAGDAAARNLAVGRLAGAIEAARAAIASMLAAS